MRCLDSDSTCARLHMHVWAPLTSAGTCGGKGEGAENARLAWAEIASGSLHSTFTFFFLFFLNTVKTRRDRLKQPTFTVFCVLVGKTGLYYRTCQVNSIGIFKQFSISVCTHERKRITTDRSPRLPRAADCRVVGVSRGGSRPARGRETHRARVSTLDSLSETLGLLSRTSRPRGDRDTRDALGALLLTT